MKRRKEKVGRSRFSAPAQLCTSHGEEHKRRRQAWETSDRVRGLCARVGPADSMTGAPIGRETADQNLADRSQRPQTTPRNGDQSSRCSRASFLTSSRVRTSPQAAPLRCRPGRMQAALTDGVPSSQSSPRTSSRSGSSPMSRTSGSRVRQTLDPSKHGPRALTDARHLRADSLRMQVTYTETYPDEPPELELEALEGDVDDDELQFMKDGLLESANESLGMVSPSPVGPGERTQH